MSDIEKQPVQGFDKDHLSSDGEGALPILADSEDGVAQDSKLRKVLGSNAYTTQRRMKERHLTMIAIGGTIGTGIFLSAGTAVATAGPAGAVLAYCAVGLFVAGVIFLLGEMSSFIPVSGSLS